MQIEQLRQVIAIAETGSMNRAARKLFLSQPNISASMKALEKEIGHQIFDRSHGPARFTPFGKMFLQHAYGVCEKVDRLRSFCDNREMITISLNITSYHMPEAYAAYVKMLDRYDGMYSSFTYTTGHVRFVMDQLLADRADLGIQMLTGTEKEEILRDLHQTDWEYRSLAPSPFGVVVGPKHPYYKRSSDTLTLNDIKHFPHLINNSIDDLIGMEQKSWIAFAHYGLRNVEISSPNDYKTYLHDGDAFFICTYQKYQEMRTMAPDLRQFRLVGGMDACEIGYICSRQDGLSAEGEEYLALLKEELDKNPLLG